MEQKETTKQELAKPQLFSVGDWLHIAVAGLMMITGIVLAIVFGPRYGIGAIVSSAGLSVVCIIYLLVFIFNYKLPDFRKRVKGITTKHGIILYLSPLMEDLPFGTVEEWTISVMQHWKKTMNWDMEKQRKAIRGVEIYMYDKKYLHDGKRKIKGYVLGKSICISTLPWEERIKDNTGTVTPFRIVKSLFRHELSHVLVNSFAGDKYSSEGSQHKLFKDKNLGA